MKVLRVQPGQECARYPHPFHIDMNTGKVLAQDFWNGVPLLFLEFTPRSRTETKKKIDEVNHQNLIELQEKFDLVFTDKKGEPITYIFGQGYQLDIIEI